MLCIVGSPLYQWDLNRQLEIDSETLGDKFEVHCCMNGDPNSLVVEPIIDGDSVLVNIPNVLLQRNGTLRVYVVVEGDTVYDQSFYVLARPKPDTYVYTETEVLSYRALDERISAIEEGGGGGDHSNCATTDDVKLTREGALALIMWLAGNEDATGVSASNASDFSNQILSKGVVVSAVSTMYAPGQDGFTTYGVFDSLTGNMTTRAIGSKEPILLSINTVYIAVGNNLYKVGNVTALRQFVAKAIGVKEVNLSNYYTKSEVNNIVQESRADVSDWWFVDDPYLDLLAVNASHYKILGAWFDENGSERLCSYQIDLPGCAYDFAGEMLDYLVPVTYRTPTMDENTQFYFRINEDGVATLYRNDEPDPEFCAYGYFYWGVEDQGFEPFKVTSGE